MATRLLLAAVASLCVMCVLCESDRLPWDSPCRLMIVSELQLGDKSTKNLTIPENCDKGPLDWHYPCGTLTLEASRTGGDFDLCLAQSWSTDIKWISDITAGRHQDLPLMTENKTTCASSSNGQVKLLLHATDMQLYMTTLDYQIVSKH